MSRKTLGKNEATPKNGYILNSYTEYSRATHQALYRANLYKATNGRSWHGNPPSADCQTFHLCDEMSLLFNKNNLQLK